MTRWLLVGSMVGLLLLFVGLTFGKYSKPIAFASDATRSPSFQVENYKINMPIAGIKGLVELSSQEYGIYKKLFANEKIFKAPSISFLGFTWDLMVGVVDGRIYKINPGIQTNSKDRANEISMRTLDYCRSMLGPPKEQKTGFFVWDTRDGNIILQTAETKEGFGIFLFVTSRAVKNYKKLN